jgi:hypothetical protein
MRQLLFLLLGITTLTSGQPKVATVGVVNGTADGISIGAFINHRSPASITAFVSGSVFTTLDSGVTWTEARIPGLKDNQGLFLANDSKGNLYYFYSTPVEKGTEGFFSKSTDGGKKWSESESFGVAPGTATSFTMGSHPKKDALTLVWTQTDKPENSDCITNVFTINTASGGKKWSEPRKLSKDPGACDNSAKLIATSPLVSKDGKTLVLWASKDKIFMDRSFDGGDMWLNSDIKVAEQTGGPQPVIPGSASNGPGFSVALDNSTYRTVGTIYLIYTDQKFGSTDTDIMLLRSPNNGDNWTYAVRLNKDEPGTHQYSPRITVDQETAFACSVYFDRRVNNGVLTDVYLNYSKDGGNNFLEKKITDVPFTPDGTIPELLSIAAHKGLINILWTYTEGGKTTVRSATLREDKL